MDLKQLLKRPEIRGVCVGWCPDPDHRDAFKGIDAHAHHSPLHRKYHGLICLASARHYNATTIRHELAHIIRGNDRHDESYWAVVRSLGGRKERRYNKPG